MIGIRTILYEQVRNFPLPVDELSFIYISIKYVLSQLKIFLLQNFFEILHKSQNISLSSFLYFQKFFNIFLELIRSYPIISPNLLQKSSKSPEISGENFL